LTIIPITGNQETTKPEILKAKQLIWMMSKGTDIDRLKGIFTDYRNAGDFHPTYHQSAKSVILAQSFASYQTIMACAAPITAKFLLTCSGILILLVFHNFYSGLLRIHIISVIPAFVAIFLFVLFWQLFLHILTN
jgi:hypothetical protein